MIQSVRFWPDHFSQGKNKIPFYTKQIINKSARVIFGLARLVIKTHGSESRGQEEAACTRVFSGLRDHYNELFTQMAALKF